MNREQISAHECQNHVKSEMSDRFFNRQLKADDLCEIKIELFCVFKVNCMYFRIKLTEEQCKNSNRNV